MIHAPPVQESTLSGIQSESNEPKQTITTELATNTKNSLSGIQNELSVVQPSSNVETSTPPDLDCETLPDLGCNREITSEDICRNRERGGTLFF